MLVNQIQIEQFCNEFDRVCARVGMIAYRSEDETISKPAWKTIKKEMKKEKKFKDWELIRISRLSVMPVPKPIWDNIVKMSQN